MNYNDIIAQQQAALNQVMQNAHNWTVLSLGISFACFILTAWVVYMFYARLRDIADELRQLRIAFQMAEERKIRSAPPARRPESPSDEGRYMPRPS